MTHKVQVFPFLIKLKLLILFHREIIFTKSFDQFYFILFIFNSISVDDAFESFIEEEEEEEEEEDTRSAFRELFSFR